MESDETGPRGILLIDDTNAVIDFVREVLEPEGYRLYVAKDGEAGIARAALARPDLVLLDVMMPGLDGYETCRRLKARPETAKAPVIFLSALAGGIDKANAFAAGGADYVTKPMDALELLARVRAQLAVRELERRREREEAELARLVAERTKELELSLAERDGLLHELSHRVKNNLQLLISMVQHQIAAGSCREGQLESLAGRIETLALAYEQLSSSGRLDGVDMADYLRAVVYVVLEERPERRVEPILDLDRITLPIDRAMPLALIAFELADNVAEHAYGAGGGPLLLELRGSEGECSLTVRDRGPGCRYDPSGAGGGLGFVFVGALASQLRAVVEEGDGGEAGPGGPARGAAFTIRFPLGPGS